jgi:transcriptional regulator PpsR
VPVVKVFKTPKQSLGGIDTEAVATLIAAASDIALVMNVDGVIQDLVCQGSELAASLRGLDAFIGKPWAETVSPESRTNVALLMREAAERKTPAWQEVRHPASSGTDVAILYAVVRTRKRGDCIAIGREVQAITSLQQRLVEAQIAMERGYSRLRHAEARYRILFQVSTEPALIVDGATEKVVEANPAALQLTGYPTRNIVGGRLNEVFRRESAAAVKSLLSKARASLQTEGLKVKLKHDPRDHEISALLFRQDTTALILVRFALCPDEAGEPFLSYKDLRLLKSVEKTPDGFVVTDELGRIIAANPAFIEMAQLVSEDQARGRPLEQWVGRPGIDLRVFMTSLRQHEAFRLFTTILHGEQGATTEIEVSAAPVDDRDEPIFVFAIRNVSQRLHTRPGETKQLPRSAEQLTELIGRVPLKDIVRETTEIIERLCIEAALRVTGENRASAADMLGVSRQSLYVKLRRFGILDPVAEPDENQ